MKDILVIHCYNLTELCSYVGVIYHCNEFLLMYNGNGSLVHISTGGWVTIVEGQTFDNNVFLLLTEHGPCGINLNGINHVDVSNPLNMGLKYHAADPSTILTTIGTNTFEKNLWDFPAPLIGPYDSNCFKICN